MTRRMSTIAGAMLALAAIWPSAAQTSAADLVPPAIRTRGTLVMGTSNLIPPMSYLDTDNETNIGLEPDLAREIARRLGLKLQIVSIPFDTLMVAMQAKRFDFVMASLNDTASRRTVVDAIDYMDGSDLLVVQGGNPRKVRTVIDICGLPVGALSGSEGEREFQDLAALCVAQGKPPPDIKSFRTSGMVDIQLLTGRVLATIQSSPRAIYTIRISNGKKELVPQGTISLSRKSLQLPRGSELLPAFTAAMQDLMADGTYQSLLAKWDLSQLAIDKITVNEAGVKPESVP